MEGYRTRAACARERRCSAEMERQCDGRWAHSSGIGGFDQSWCVTDLADDRVRSMPVCNPCVIVPDVGEISLSFRRPDYRRPTTHHPECAYGSKIQRYRGAYPHRRPANGYLCRSPRGAGGAFPRETAVTARSLPGRHPVGSLSRPCSCSSAFTIVAF